MTDDRNAEGPSGQGNPAPQPPVGGEGVDPGTEAASAYFYADRPVEHPASAPQWNLGGGAPAGSTSGGPNALPSGSTRGYSSPGFAGPNPASPPARRSAAIVAGVIAAGVVLVVAVLVIVLASGSDGGRAATAGGGTNGDGRVYPGYNAPTAAPSDSGPQCESAATTEGGTMNPDEVRVGPTHFSVDLVGDFEFRPFSRTPGGSSGIGIEKRIGQYLWVSDLELGLVSPWGQENPLDQAAGAFIYCWAGSRVFGSETPRLENWQAKDILVDGTAAVRIDADIIVDMAHFMIDLPGDHLIAIAIDSSPRTYVVTSSPLIEDTKYRPTLERIIAELQVDNDI